MVRKKGASTEPVQTFNGEELTPEDIELLNDFDRNVPPVQGSYSVKYNTHTIILADKFEHDIQSILAMNPETVSGFKSTVESIAAAGLLAPTTLSHYIMPISKLIRDFPIESFTSDTYSSLIALKKDVAVNALRYILSIWFRLGHPGIDSKTMETVNVLRRPSSQGRKRITSGDLTEGWYTTQEYEDLIDTYWIDLESGKVNLRDTSALLLTGQFGRRVLQLACLKVCDFQFEGNTQGVSGKRVAFPGVKDRGAEKWFRGSKIEVHPLGDDLWNLCAQQINSTIAHHEAFFGRVLSNAERGQLPFLQKNLKGFASLKKFVFQTSHETDDSTSVFHLSGGVLSNILARKKGTEVVSHRLGKPLREFAYRMRYTRARQLARLGIPRTTLQYWLGHEDSYSLEHYYDDPAEDARLLDIQMQTILAPLAQGFLGSLRDRESDAIRGNDLSSRIELDGRHNVGTCGEHGFCSASVPIPCYRCSKFQPWVHAPHEEVLIRLIERQEEENNIHISSKSRRILVPLQLEKDIAAVTLVIRMCDARKLELAAAQKNAE